MKNQELQAILFYGMNETCLTGNKRERFHSSPIISEEERLSASLGPNINIRRWRRSRKLLVFLFPHESRSSGHSKYFQFSCCMRIVVQWFTQHVSCRDVLKLATLGWKALGESSWGSETSWSVVPLDPLISSFTRQRSFERVHGDEFIMVNPSAWALWVNTAC